MMGMKLEEAIRRYKNNAEYERTHGNLQGCLEFRQLAKWLEQLQKIEQILDDWTKTEELEWKIREVLENGKDDWYTKRIQ